MQENPSILSHVSLGTNYFEAASAFYDSVLAAVNARRLVDHPEAIAYGKAFPEFWLTVPFDNKAANVGNGTHLSFFAASKAEVDAFYAAALAGGGTDEGPPGPRPEYGAPFYGCYVRDLDGHKIEATFWDMAMAQGPDASQDNS